MRSEDQRAGLGATGVLGSAQQFTDDMTTVSAMGYELTAFRTWALIHNSKNDTLRQLSDISYFFNMVVFH